MKKLLLITLLIPIILQAQTQDDWLTPFADAQFESGKIVYAFNASPDMAISKIKPLYFSESLMELQPGLNMPALNPEDVTRQQQKIREYLIEEDAIKLSNNEQEEYLQLVAMVLIWDMELDKQTLMELQDMTSKRNSQNKDDAELILQVVEVYQSLK